MEKKDRAGVFLLIVFTAAALLRLLFIDVMTYSDEGMFIQMAKDVHLGSMPYRDFFLSHTPLEIYMNAFMFRLFGVGLVQAKFMPVFFSILSVFLLYHTAKKFYGRPHALMAAFLFGLSLNVIYSTCTAMLYSPMIFFSILSYSLFLDGLHKRNNPGFMFFLSGFSSGLAALSKMFGVLPLMTSLLFLLCCGGRRNMRGVFLLLFGFSSVLIPFLAYFTLSSPQFLHQVFLYQLSKPTYNIFSKTIIFLIVGFGGYLALSLSGLVGTYYALRDCVRREADIFFMLNAVLGVLLILSARHMMYNNILMYFTIITPALSMLGGKAVRIFDGKDNWLKILYVSLLIVGLLPQYATFLFCGFQRELAWDSSVRMAARYIRENSLEDDTVFGTSIVAPPVAFFSGRRMTGNANELPHYRFLTGELNESYIRDAVKKSRYVVVLTVPPAPESDLDGYNLGDAIQLQPDFHYPGLDRMLEEECAVFKEIGYVGICEIKRGR